MTRKTKLKTLGWMAGLAAAALVAGSARAGSLEPPGPPAPTMKSLDEVPPAWSTILPASERFVLVMGGVAVLDRETGLVWQREPWTHPLFRTVSWASASVNCFSLVLGGRMGWRLPKLEELSSLLDPTTGEAGQFLPSGHPFVQISMDAVSPGYWTSTTAGAGQKVMVRPGLSVGAGCSSPPCVGSLFYVGQGSDETTAQAWWCVRGGHGHDGQ